MERTTKTDIWHRIAHWYTKGMMALGCTLLGGIVVIMGVQVFFRYVLNDSLIWAEEMSRYLLVWITFLFLGIAFQRGELISLSLVLRKVPRRLQIVLTLVGFGASLTMLTVLVWYGFKFAEVNAIQTLPAFDFIWASIAGPNEELNVSSYWLYASVPVGAALLVVHLLIGLFVRIRRIAAGEAVFDEEIAQEPVGEGTR
jgi:TRAP-type C4-dicarboxylate transport system permease small subunit